MKSPTKVGTLKLVFRCGYRVNSQTIILLHGFPFNRSMWSEQFGFLTARGYRVLAPDLRGLGAKVAQTSVFETSTPNHRLKSVPPATMDDMARDVASMMEAANVHEAIICGLSMGCYVAFEFVQLFPARVQALILCGPRAQGPDAAEKQSRETQAQRALNEGMDFAVESITTKLLARQTVDQKPQVVARVREMVLETDPRGAAAAQLGMAARRDYSADLARISVPTLVVAGHEDGVRTPRDAEFIQEGISQSELLVIRDAGHLMNMEQPDIFNEAIDRFLRD